MQPGDKVRVITGTPSKKSQGTPPEAGSDGTRNYHLFLREAVLQKPGQIVSVQLKQMELARAVFSPEAKDGLGGAS
jgi:hypothetical protein